MNKWTLFLCVFAQIYAVNASWFWPFGAGDDSDGPRLSELMEPASLLIDDATDLASDGKIQESVAKYREALEELSKVESDYPDRAATTEFASLRNKRAYVNAAIDTLLLAEARNNAKAVAITDTTELEKKYLRKKGLLPPEDESDKKKTATSDAASLAGKLAKDPGNRRLRLALIGEYIQADAFDKAKAETEILLKTNATDAAALNLKAVCEASSGDFKSAEKTLVAAITANPGDFNGYYNMANLKLRKSGDKAAARTYYEAGRAAGGPEDAELETAVKE